MKSSYLLLMSFFAVLVFLVWSDSSSAQSRSETSTQSIVLRAARLLEVDTGQIVAPAEILVQGERIDPRQPGAGRQRRHAVVAA